MGTLKTINSIELSSLCNNKCRYCPSPSQGEHRETGFMDMATFKMAISWVIHFCGEETQKELNLFGVGESLLNPECIEMVRYARQHVPLRIPIHLNTNGKLMTKEIAQDLKDAGITSIDVTGHDAYITARTIRILQDTGIQGSLSFDFITNPNNWAGQVDWFEPRYEAGPCPWTGYGQCMISHDGNIHHCCIDAFGKSVRTNIYDDLTKYEIDHFDLCNTCHHDRNSNIIQPDLRVVA